MVIGLSEVQFGLSVRIGRQEVLLPINHKNYNFLEKKNVWPRHERNGKFVLKTDKGDVNCLMSL